MVLDGQDFSAQIKEIDDFIDEIGVSAGSLIAVLHKAQSLAGYLPQKLQEHIAKKLMLPASKVYGVVSFYSFFNMTKKGKYKIAVCMGTACFVRGSSVILDEFKKQLGLEVGCTSDDGMFSLDAVRCIGACGLAPVININDKVYGRLKRKDVKKIIEEHIIKGVE